MSRAHPSEIRALLSKLGIRPRKAWGQHFLCDENVLRKIVDASQVTEGETVLEIGPGLGVLTEELLKRGARVLAVERDPHLVRSLEDLFHPHLTVVQGDFLRFDLQQAYRLGAKKVVSNLPFYITSPVLERLIPSSQFDTLVVTVQKEVADRLVGKPGTPNYGALTVFAQHHREVQRLFDVAPACFYPPPDVASSVVRMDRRETDLTQEEQSALRRIVRAAFGERRKTLGNALKSLLKGESAKELLRTVGLDPRRRGETLSLAEFEALARHFAATSSEGTRQRSSPSS